MKISTATMWAIFWIGAGSFVPLLFLQYVGEEGVYAIATQEMHTTGDLLHPTLYGQSFGRPGLYCWLILLLIRVLGQQHVLIAARLIAISSTLLIGLTLAWLVRRIFNDRMLAAFAAATFLSGDVLLYRGWLAYVDPLFSLLTFGAMSALWVAIEERRRALFFLAVLGVIGSFLAKALTGYSSTAYSRSFSSGATVTGGFFSARGPLRFTGRRRLSVHLERDRWRHRRLGDARSGVV